MGNGIICYEAVLKINANNTEALFGIGLVFFEQKAFIKAEEYFDKVLLIDPTFITAKQYKQQAQDESRKLCIIPYQKLKLGTKLGEGSFGAVFKATLDGEDVAVKEIFYQTQNIEKTFISEATMMAKFSSDPYILKIRGICIDIGHYSLVMELSTKGSLFDVLHNGQSISGKVRYQIAMDFTMGLKTLHDAKTAHRDFKSQNILLDRACPICLDFEKPPSYV